MISLNRYNNPKRHVSITNTPVQFSRGGILRLRETKKPETFLPVAFTLARKFLLDNVFTYHVKLIPPPPKGISICYVKATTARSYMGKKESRTHFSLRASV